MTRCVRLSAANSHDATHLLPLIDAIPPIIGPQGKPGRPRKRPAKLHAYKAYDSSSLQRALRARGITPRIARRGIDTLPPRLLQSDGERPHIDPIWLERQIDAYYIARGWDREGRPTPAD